MKENKVSYFDLGASLYIPCIHKNLMDVVQNGVNGSRSIVICLEDSVKEDQLPQALRNLKSTLNELTANSSMKRFVRIRNPLMLSEILKYKNIEKIDGFILPKFDLDNMRLYEDVISNNANKSFSYMPILETKQVFDSTLLSSIRKELMDWQHHIPCIRIGGNDLMNILGIKRMSGVMLYDTPLRSVVEKIIMEFRTNGFEISAPVFDFIDDIETLKKEVEMDIAYGFYAKTTIHPSHIDIIESAFQKFTEAHSEQAEQVVNKDSAAVFKLNGQMMEKTCHNKWATRTLNLAKRYC